MLGSPWIVASATCLSFANCVGAGVLYQSLQLFAIYQLPDVNYLELVRTSLGICGKMLQTRFYQKQHAFQAADCIDA